MPESKSFFVWWNGYVKCLVWTRKFDSELQCYEDCISIQDPKAKTND